MLTVAGLQVPVIPLFEVVGKTGDVAPEQIGAIASNVGVTVGLTVIAIVAVVAHCPAFGVNVYVPLVVLLTVAGLHVPVILLVDVVGKIGGGAFAQIGSMASNVGRIDG